MDGWTLLGLWMLVAGAVLAVIAIGVAHGLVPSLGLSAILCFGAGVLILARPS